MDITVVISYYKALDNLKLILKALDGQSCKNFEVVISEDDNNPVTSEFISLHSHLYGFPITHIFQKEDRGFRKNEMLNKAIMAAKTEKMVFIDGDCIPHRHFVKSYVSEMVEGYMLDGRAVMLDKNMTDRIKRDQSLSRLNLVSIFLSRAGSKKDAMYFPFFPLSLSKSGRGLVGRNWGVSKKDLIAVNGFDMDYVYAGVGEDVDIEWRLKANGVKSKSMKNKAIVYHLYHTQVYSEEMVEKNFEMMFQKQKQNHIKCLNGLTRLKP